MSSNFHNVFLHVISVCRNPKDNYDARLRRIGKKNKWLLFLSRFGVSGLIVYCFLKSFRSTTIVLYRDGVIDDHASGVIKGVLQRTGYSWLLHERKSIKVTWMHALYGFVSLIHSVLKAYRLAGPRNEVEFARCAMISRYAMDYCFH